MIFLTPLETRKFILQCFLVTFATKTIGTKWEVHRIEKIRYRVMRVSHGFVLLRRIYLTEVSSRDCALFFRGNGETCELFSRQGAFFFFFNPLLNDVYNVA